MSDAKLIMLATFASAALVFAGVRGMQSNDKALKIVSAVVTVTSPAVKGLIASRAGRKTAQPS